MLGVVPGRTTAPPTRPLAPSLLRPSIPPPHIRERALAPPAPSARRKHLWKAARAHSVYKSAGETLSM